MTSKTSEGTQRRSLAGMEPSGLDTGLTPEVEGEGTSEALGASARFPSVKNIRAAQLTINARQIEWLATCKRLCELRLPSEVFTTIPNDIWKLAPWGTKVVVMRAPRYTQMGIIHLASQAQTPNFHGWVLTTGPNVCDARDDAVVRGKECPYRGLGYDFDPLLLVGEMVQFNPMSGREFSTTRFVPEDKRREFLITSIADIWGPIPAPSEEDWSTSLT